jgi:nickel-type superoxide dismutase maturation protease
LPPGTLVIAHKAIKNLKPGQVVIVRHDGKEKIKRINEIKDNQIFLLGDYEQASTDSRHFGWVGQEYVIARAFWPRRLKL